MFFGVSCWLIISLFPFFFPFCSLVPSFPLFPFPRPSTLAPKFFFKVYPRTTMDKVTPLRVSFLSSFMNVSSYLIPLPPSSRRILTRSLCFFSFPLLCCPPLFLLESLIPPEKEQRTGFSPNQPRPLPWVTRREVPFEEWPFSCLFFFFPPFFYLSFPPFRLYSWFLFLEYPSILSVVEWNSLFWVTSSSQIFWVLSFRDKRDVMNETLSTPNSAASLMISEPGPLWENFLF